MQKKNSVAKAELASEEWNFTSCPEEELAYCLAYELCRELDTQEIRKRMQPVICSDPLMAGATPFYGEYGPVIWGNYDLLKMPEWPNTPWLKLDKQKRQAIANAPRLGSAILALEDRAEWLKDSSGNWQPYMQREENGYVTSHACIRIQWSTNDSVLRKRFADWLKARRPSEVKVKEGRGQTSPRDLLKRLGAYRLLKYYGYEKAAQKTLKGKQSLYSDQAAWSRAKKQTVELNE